MSPEPTTGTRTARRPTRYLDFFLVIAGAIALAACVAPPPGGGGGGGREVGEAPRRSRGT